MARMIPVEWWKMVRFWKYFKVDQTDERCEKESGVTDNNKVSAWAVKNRVATKWYGEDWGGNRLGKMLGAQFYQMLSLGPLSRSHVRNKNDRNITKRFIHCICNPSTVKVKKLGTAVGRRKTSLQLPAGNTDSAPWTVTIKLVGAEYKKVTVHPWIRLVKFSASTLIDIIDFSVAF